MERRRSQRRTDADFDSPPEMGDATSGINFSLVDTSALKKYKRHFQVRTKGPGKEDELAAAVAAHFAMLEVPAQEPTIETFIFNIKNND